MKNLFLSLITLLLFGASASAQNNTPPEFSGQVKYESGGANGTVTVTSSGAGKNRAQALGEASVSAIYVILFRGLPGSQYDLPMVSDESKKNTPVVTQLLNGGYSTFITESTFIDEEKLSKKTDGVKGYRNNYRMTINCDALRRYLEQNGIIRKFGL